MRRLKQISIALGLILGTSMVFGALTEPDRAQIPVRNLLKNPGFENGKASWTASAGTFTINTTASNVGSGVNAGSWATGASSRTLTSGAVAIPAGLYGRAGVASCIIKGATADHTISAFDGTNLLGTAVITHASTYSRSSVNFILPSSGNIQLRITSASSETLYVDDCYLGAAEGFNVSKSSQATMYGSVKFPEASSCVWIVNSTSFASFSADSDCTLPSGGGIEGAASAPATKIPAIVFGTLPPGDYRFVAKGGFYAADNAQCMYEFYDGTNESEISPTYPGASGGVFWPIIEGRIKYTTAQSNIQIQIRAKVASGSHDCDIYNDSSAHVGNLVITAYRYPISDEQNYTPDKLANSWSGYTQVTGGCSTASATYADPSACTGIALTQLTNKNFGTVTTAASSLPGIIVTPSRAGSYFICAGVTTLSDSIANPSIRMVDGSGGIINKGHTQLLGIGGNTLAWNLCGIYNATSTTAFTVKLQLATNNGNFNVQTDQASSSSAIDWSIFQIDQTFPGPILTPSLAYWAGYQTGASWSRAANSYADPTKTGTNATTTTVGDGVTVTSAASDLPGVTFTPSSLTAVYAIQANTILQCSASDKLRLYDGTTASGEAGCNTDYQSMTIRGIFKPGTTSSYTVKIQMYGTGSFGDGVLAQGEHGIEWTIEQIRP